MKKKLLEYKIKNRYLIYMILFSYCIGSFLGILSHNVSSIEYDAHYESFDTLPTTATPITTTFFDTYSDDYTKFKVEALTARSVPNVLMYKIDSLTAKGIITFSIANIQYLSMWARLFFGGSGIVYSYFNSSTANMFSIKYEYKSNTSIKVINPSNGDTIFWYRAAIVSTSFYFFNFTFLGSSCIFEYKNYTGGVYHSTDSGSYTFGGLSGSFNKIFLKTTTVGGGLTYGYHIDDIRMQTIATEGEICGYDMNIYNQRGDLSPYYFDDMAYKNIYENFKTPISTTVTGVSLSCNQAQYEDDSNLANYYLIFNGINYSSPECFYLSDFGTRILFWKMDRVISNETLSFQFTHTLKTGFRYWLVGEGGNRDLDQDGDILSGKNFISYRECHWQWYSWFPLPFYVCNDVWEIENNFDLSYNFYYTTIETPNTYNYTDSLGLHGYSYKNSTGYVYDINTPNGIIGSYLINDRAYSYSIEVHKNGSYFDTKGYPYTCIYPSGSFGLTPTTIGKYQFKLKKIGYVDNITAYVIGTLSNFYVTTNPPITNQFDNYDVTYKFYHLQGFNGSLDKFDVLEYINSHAQSTYTSDIASNSTGTIDYYSTSSSAEYWRLFVNRNGFFTPVGNLATHYIRLPSVVDNTVNIEPKAIEIIYNNPENRTVYISGQHTFSGCDIGVYANGVLIAKVGGSQNYGIFYAPKTSGVYTIDLRLLQDNVLTVVAISPYQLTVTVIPEEEQERVLLEAPYTYIAGTIVTIVCLILPVIALGKLNIQSEILKYVPLFSGILGFIVSCMIGFFPWYAIFGLVLVLVIVLAVIYQSKKG